jgi:hypothetical protein
MGGVLPALLQVAVRMFMPGAGLTYPYPLLTFLLGNVSTFGFFDHDHRYS